MMNDLEFSKLAALMVAEADASGAYDPAKLEKISSVVTGLLGAAGNGLMSVSGGGDVLPAAIGGYLAGDKGGFRGIAAGLGSQALINKGVEKGVGAELAGSKAQPKSTRPDTPEAIKAWQDSGGEAKDISAAQLWRQDQAAAKQRYDLGTNVARFGAPILGERALKTISDDDED